MKMYLLCVLLAGCIQVQPPTHHILQTLPSVDADYAVYAGCVRAVERMVQRSRAAQQGWTPANIAVYCEDIRDSFRLDRQRSKGNSSL